MTAAEEAPEEEFPETESFTLTAPAVRIDVADLPRSPKALALTAAACGWTVQAWLALGEFEPTRYVNGSKEGAKNPYNAGDVKFDGYIAKLFTVEARDLLMPLGFRAHYVGKQYADGRKTGAGSFSFAQIVDPVGIPRSLQSIYRPIRQLRGKFETDKSFERRVNDAQKVAYGMAADYNDGETVFNAQHTFGASGDFDAWIAEWRSFTAPTTKRATT